jgi:D-alanine-D-alanine ligase
VTGRPPARLRIALITGGSTPERDVALAGAGEVLRALRVAGHEVTAVDTVHGALGPEQEGQFLALRVGRKPPEDQELTLARDHEDVPGLLRLKAVASADIAFLVLHGLDGEGGLLQAVLELGGLPYTGSGVLASALAMEKASAKRVLKGAGVPTPRFAMVEFEAPEDRRGEIEALGMPVVVKPSRVGSSVGLRIATGFDDVCAAVAEARRHDRCVIVEEMLPGREFTVGVVGEPDGVGLEPLGVGEIVTGSGLFDYHAKYTPGIAEEIFPADIPEALSRRLRDLTVATHRALGLRDFSRVDFRLDARGEPFVLEANTLPGMTTRSLLPQSAAVLGISFPVLCDRIARLAAKRRD